MVRARKLRRCRTAPSTCRASCQAASAAARAVARAGPAAPIYLADEPTGNLDSKNGEAVMTLLQELHREGSR